MLRRLRERFARNPIPEGWERSLHVLRAFRPAPPESAVGTRLAAIEDRLRQGLEDVVTKALRDLGCSPSEIIGLAL